MATTNAPHSVHDLAKAILHFNSKWEARSDYRGAPGISSMKLHKLCYLIDLECREVAGFKFIKEQYQHTASGPQYRELIPYHKGMTLLSYWPEGSIRGFIQEELDYIQVQVESYTGFMSGPMLSRIAMAKDDYTSTDKSGLN